MEKFFYVKYKWEFMRRNKAYINEVREWNALIDNPSSMPPKDPDEFIRKWKILAPLNPERTFEEILDVLYQDLDIEAMHRAFFPEYNPAQIIVPGMVKPEILGSYKELKKSILKTGVIPIALDLNYSRKELLENVQIIIDKWKSKYKRTRKRKKPAKLHFENFDDYLRVYDMRQEGKSWAKIAEAVALSSVQTGRNYYKAACNLIEKGINYDN